MSLRLRLVLLTVALVTLVVLVLSGLYLNSLVDSLSAAALERSQVASQQVNAFITEFINRRSQDFTNPTSIEETKTLWRAIVVNEQDVTATLVRTMALSPALVEINVAGNEGQVLASSNPVRSGQPLQALESFAAWRDQSLYRRLVDVIVRKPDYQVRVPLGIGGDQPVFMIQVVASSVLLRDAVLPQLIS